MFAALLTLGVTMVAREGAAMKRYGWVVGALCALLTLSGCLQTTAPASHHGPEVVVHIAQPDATQTVAPPLPTVDRQPPRVDFFGDSLTWGFAATTPEQSYAALVAQALHGVRVGYDGEFGATAQLGAQILQQTPAPTGIDVFIIEWGTDDREPPDAFQANYHFVIQALRAADPNARIVCLRPWQDPTNGYQPEYWQAIQAECGAWPMLTADLAPLYLDFGLHGPGGGDTYRGPRDWFHPNDAGHAAIAQLILRQLTPVRLERG
jgi:lysophospholipase L1-like esterase